MYTSSTSLSASSGTSVSLLVERAAFGVESRLNRLRSPTSCLLPRQVRGTVASSSQDCHAHHVRVRSRVRCTVVILRELCERTLSSRVLSSARRPPQSVLLVLHLLDISRHRSSCHNVSRSLLAHYRSVTSSHNGRGSSCADDSDQQVDHTSHKVRYHRHGHLRGYHQLAFGLFRHGTCRHSDLRFRWARAAVGNAVGRS